MSSQLVTVPMTGGANEGSYYVEVTTGSNTLQVIVDTGSSDLIVADQTCSLYLNSALSDCVYQSVSSAESALSGQQSASCTMNTAYSGPTTTEQNLDCYGSGFIIYNTAENSLNVSTLSAPNAFFGAATEWSASYRGNGNDGIWGLAYPSLSKIYTNDGDEQAFDTLTSYNNLANAFALCFNPGSVGGGSMVFGGGYKSSMTFVKVIAADYYSVNVDQMKIGNDVIPATPGVPIVDSGTTYLIVSKPAYDQILTSICNAIDPNNSLCTSQTVDRILTPTQLADSPNITIAFPAFNSSYSGYTLEIPPTNYWFDNGNGMYTLGLDYTNGGMIIGDTALRGQFVLFNKAQYYLGFTTTNDCTVESNYTEPPLGVTNSPGLASMMVMNNFLLFVCMVFMFLFRN